MQASEGAEINQFAVKAMISMFHGTIHRNEEIVADSEIFFNISKLVCIFMYMYVHITKRNKNETKTKRNKKQYKQKTITNHQHKH